MKAPQIIMIMMMSGDMLLHIIKHGEPRDDNYNANYMALNVVALSLLLWWGGFWG